MDLRLTFATFNVRGLSNDLKKEELEYDALKYKADIIGMQESKVRNHTEKILPSGNILFFFDQKNTVARGVGFFLIGKNL